MKNCVELSISKRLICFLAFFTCCVTASCSDPLPTMQSPEIVAATARGDQILQAIASYRKANGGALPSQLDSLVPDYLTKVPEGTAFGSWSYRVNHERPYFFLGCAASDPSRLDRVNLGSSNGQPFRLEKVDPS
jgi:hypothetical protein